MGLLSWQWCLGAVEFTLSFWCIDRLVRDRGIVPDWLRDWLNHQPVLPSEPLFVWSNPQDPVARLCTNCDQPFLHYGPRGRQNIDGWCPTCRSLEKHMDESLAVAIKPGSKNSWAIMKSDLVQAKVRQWEHHQKNRPYMWL